jgi:hypothetical protein
MTQDPVFISWYWLDNEINRKERRRFVFCIVNYIFGPAYLMIFEVISKRLRLDVGI